MPLGLRFAAAFALGSMFGGSGAVSAQSVAGGANLQIPPDVRAESMGGVWAPLSTTPYAAWGNVGGLGLLEGFQAAHMDAQLVPGLADDVHVYYRSVVYGHELDASGLRASIGYNRTDLNYGKSVSTDPGSPDPLGTFESTEHTNGITIPDSLAAGMTRNEREGIIVRDGYEIRLLGVVSYRRGTILDDAGKIWGKTEGWGVSFFGHAGFDFAEIPQFEELQRVKKWSAWVRIPVWDLF